jgi:hypothetical protein
MLLTKHYLLVTRTVVATGILSPGKKQAEKNLFHAVT